MTCSIELDFSHEMAFGELANLIEPYELKADIIELVGPGGGNPVIEIYGTYTDIVMFLADYTGGSDEQMQYFIGEIK